MTPADLIRLAADHLEEVGLKRGSFTHTGMRGDQTQMPVCGIGALKWAATGNPTWVPAAHNGEKYYLFLSAWQFMNKAALHEDPWLPEGPDTFMMYNDDEDNDIIDVLRVMRAAADLAEYAAT